MKMKKQMNKHARLSDSRDFTDFTHFTANTKPPTPVSLSERRVRREPRFPLLYPSKKGQFWSQPCSNLGSYIFPLHREKCVSFHSFFFVEEGEMKKGDGIEYHKHQGSPALDLIHWTQKGLSHVAQAVRMGTEALRTVGSNPSHTSRQEKRRGRSVQERNFRIHSFSFQERMTHHGDLYVALYEGIGRFHKLKFEKSFFGCFGYFGRPPFSFFGCKSIFGLDTPLFTLLVELSLEKQRKKDALSLSSYRCCGSRQLHSCS
jgi:hypothetical protein